MRDTELSDRQSLTVAHAVREALARRRLSRQALADKARISISTLEKALAGRRPFTLATTIRLEEALGQTLREAPEAASVAGTAPLHAPEELGAYSRGSTAWLEGRYLTLRPSFGAPDAIFAYRTDIAWDVQTSRLVFQETERLDAPFAQTGFVSVPNLSGTIYLVTNWQGQYRFAMIGRPTIQGELHGILTTLHAGRGSQLTPTACPIAFIPEARIPEARIPEARIAGEPIYGRITPGMDAYADCRRLLARTCEEGFAAFLPCPR